MSSFFWKFKHFSTKMNFLRPFFLSYRQGVGRNPPTQTHSKIIIFPVSDISKHVEAKKKLSEFNILAHFRQAKRVIKLSTIERVWRVVKTRISKFFPSIT